MAILTDAQIEALEAQQAQQPNQKPVQATTVGAAAQPKAQQTYSDAEIEAMSGGVVPSEAPSGFKRGLKDFVSGAGQLVARGAETVANKIGYEPATEFIRKERQKFEDIVNKEETQYQEQRKAAGEKGMDWGRVGGNLANPFNWVGGGVGGATARLATTATIGAAGQPVFGELSSPEYWKEKAKQLGWSAAGAKAGQIVGKALGRALSPEVTESEKVLRELGVTPTTGEALGGAYASVEKTLGKTPFIRGLVNPRQQQSIEQFNRGIFNKPLKDIGVDTIPEGMYGSNAMQFADKQLAKRYDEVLSNFNLTYDKTIGDSMLNTIKQAGLSTKQQNAATNFLSQRMLRKLEDGKVADGDMLKTIDREIRNKANKYVNSKSVEEQEIGDALLDSYSIFKNALYQANPKAAEALKQTDKAFAELETVRKAVLKADIDTKNGRIFTPDQLVSSVEQMGNTRFGKKMVSEGRGLLQKEAEAGKAILQPIGGSTSEVGSVGILGLIYAAQSNPVTAATLATTTGLLYTKMGQKAADALIRKRPEVVQQIGDIINDLRGPITPVVGAQIEKVINETKIGKKEMRKQEQLQAPQQPQQGLFQQPQSKSDVVNTIMQTAQQKGAGQYAGLLTGIAKVESGFDTQAKNKKSTAAGLFQMTKAAQKDYGVTNPYDARQSAAGATDYFMKMMKRYNGDVVKALAAYNQGPGVIDKGLNKAGREYAMKVINASRGG